MIGSSSLLRGNWNGDLQVNSKTLLLEEQDTSVTAFGDLADSRRWQRPIEFDSDILTAAVVFIGPEFVIEKPTALFITIFPQQPPVVPLDSWVELDVRFPPKETTLVAGRIVRRERATFQTAFGEELQNDWRRP